MLGGYALPVGRGARGVVDRDVDHMARQRDFFSSAKLWVGVGLHAGLGLGL